MSRLLRFTTNLRCDACVATLKPHLDRVASIDRWEVDTSVPEKILTVEGDRPNEESIRAAVASAGYKVTGTVPHEHSQDETGATADAQKGTTYYPLLLLLTFLIGLVLVAEFVAGSFVWERAMQNFMGGFFVAFSFFKLLDLKGFAETYRMYDFVAQRAPIYGFVYPFIELALGIAYLTGFQPVLTNCLTLIVMSVSVVGVIQGLLQKRKIRCACLGTVFNLPMSTVTLLEDALMIVMATIMLGGSRHA